jgi:hypothetical protein
MSQQERTTPDDNPETWKPQDPNLSELAARAHQAFERKQTRDCLRLTDEILLKDPQNADALQMRTSIQAQMQEDLQRTGAYFRQALATERARREAQTRKPAVDAAGSEAKVEAGSDLYIRQVLATEKAETEAQIPQAQIPEPAVEAASIPSVEVVSDASFEQPLATEEAETEAEIPQAQIPEPAVEAASTPRVEVSSNAYFRHAVGGTERVQREAQTPKPAIEPGFDSRVEGRSAPYFRQVLAKEKARREAQVHEPAMEPGFDSRVEGRSDPYFRQAFAKERARREAQAQRPPVEPAPAATVEPASDARVEAVSDGRDLFAQRDAATFPRAVPPAPAVAVPGNKNWLPGRRVIILGAGVLLVLAVMTVGLLAFRSKFPTLESLRTAFSEANPPTTAVNTDPVQPPPALPKPSAKQKRPATASSGASTAARTLAATLAAGVPAGPDSAAARGTLAVSSLTSVDIYKDDVFLGSVPVSLALPAGTHTLEYRHGSLRKNVTHVVEGDATTRAMISFDVSIRINSKPWAEVFIDGVEKTALGQTPLSDVRVPIGSVLIFENPQFQPKKYRVTENETAVQNVFP